MKKRHNDDLMVVLSDDEGPKTRPYCKDIILAKSGIAGIESLSVVHVDHVLRHRELHVHPDCVEVIACLRGEKLKCLHGNLSDILRTGEVFVAFPDERHCVANGPKGRLTYSLLLRTNDAAGLVDMSRTEALDFLGRLRKSRKRIVAVKSAFASNFKAAWDLLSGTAQLTVATRVRVRHHLMSCLLLLEDALRKGVRALSAKDAVVEALMDEMQRDPLSEYSLGTLCARLSASKTGLISRFKRVSGMTPHAYLLAARIELAKKMLKNSIAVATVSERLHFSSPAHFSRVFSSVVGRSPLRWIAENIS